VLNDGVTSELEWVRKEAVVAYFEVLSSICLGTQENHDSPQPEEPVCGTRFEPGSFRILRSPNHLTMTLSVRSQSLNIKMYKTTILSVTLFGYKIWFRTEKEVCN
jgi:hypothetical protein